MIGLGSNKKSQSFLKLLGALLINIIFSAVIQLNAALGRGRKA